MAYNYEFPYTDPNFYNDDWLLKKMKELLVIMENMEEWKNEYEQAYNDFKKLYEDIEAGRFPDSIADAFKKWAALNMPELIKSMIKTVWFGLTDDGYFIAYIPDSWADIIFNTTGLDIFVAGIDYGHLALSFNA